VTPLLLHFRISHYNEKVRWALDHKGWPHLRRALVPGFHVPAVRRRTGQNQTPVLILDGAPLVGSSRILAEIEQRRPEPPLYPAAPRERERAAALERHFDEEVAPDVRRLFWAAYFDRPAECARMATDGSTGLAHAAWRTLYPLMKPVLRRNLGLGTAQVERARERLSGHFDRLEAEIGPSGYLVGDRFGVADLAVAAVMTAILRPPQFPYPLPEPWPPALRELRDGVQGRAGTRWVLDMYARHRSPSAEIAA
jgi:glutathione S-transferase